MSNESVADGSAAGRFFILLVMVCGSSSALALFFNGLDSTANCVRDVHPWEDHLVLSRQYGELARLIVENVD